MKAVNSKWKYPPAPQEFPKDAEVFIYNDYSRLFGLDQYCGAWAMPNGSRIHKFVLPGADRPDGFYSDPLAAREALEKYLKEVNKQ